MFQPLRNLWKSLRRFDMAINDIDTVITDEGLTAYKQLKYQEGNLHSPVYSFLWKPLEVQEAKCVYLFRDPHESPQADEDYCKCGFHAAKTMEYLYGMNYAHTHSEFHSCVGVGLQYEVIARLSLWGKVAVYTEGYRAQKAKIRELWFHAPPEGGEDSLRFAGEIESKYRVPVHYSVLPLALIKGIT